MLAFKYCWASFYYEMPRRIPEHTVRRIRELRRQGYTFEEISKRLGVSYVTVWKYAHDIKPVQGRVFVSDLEKFYTFEEEQEAHMQLTSEDDALFPILRYIVENRPHLLRRLLEWAKKRGVLK